MEYGDVNSIGRRAGRELSQLQVRILSVSLIRIK